MIWNARVRAAEHVRNVATRWARTRARLVHRHSRSTRTHDTADLDFRRDNVSV